MFLHTFKKKELPLDAPTLKAAKELIALIEKFSPYTSQKGEKMASLAKKLLTASGSFGAFFTGNRFRELNPAMANIVEDLFVSPFVLNKGEDEATPTFSNLYTKALKEAITVDSNSTTPEELLPRLPEGIKQVEGLLNHDWKLPKPIGVGSWSRPFPNANENETIRERFATWPQLLQTPQSLNKVVSPILKQALALFSIFILNGKWAANAEFKFSKSGGLNRPFYAKEMKILPFAEEYSGDPKADDPGRLAVQGVNFSTLKKDFRDVTIPLIFANHPQLKKIRFFIVDIRGCHGGIQASILLAEQRKNPFYF